MAYILNIETSAEACSVALGHNTECLQTRLAEGDWQHSKQVTLMIEDCMLSANVSFDQLNAVSISQGPGSYTGLRVAASAAKGICFAKNLPLIAVDTLKVISSYNNCSIRLKVLLAGFTIAFLACSILNG